MAADDRYIAPSCIDRVQKFQRVFIKYFPQFEDIHAAADEWSWLHSHWVLNPIETVRRQQAEDELERVVRALRLLATCDMAWSWSMTLVNMAAKKEGADQITKDHAVIAEAIFDLQSMHEEGVLEGTLSCFREAAERELASLPDTGSTKWDAVFAVDALRIVWWRNTDCDAPRALNPASEFAAFLQDGFDFLGVAANPVAAFRRWVKRVDRYSTIDST